VTLFPIAFYVIKAFAEGTTTEKLSLGCFATVAIILVLVNLIFKLHLRSAIWLLVIGIYIAVEAIMPLLIMVAVGTVLDEFLFSPLHKHFKNKASINAEIDKRMS
jgi:hypothetical protein